MLLLRAIGSVVLIEPDRCDILADRDLVREPQNIQVVPQRPHLHLHLAGKSSEVNARVLPDMIVDLRPDLLVEDIDTRDPPDPQISPELHHKQEFMRDQNQLGEHHPERQGIERDRER